MNAVAKRDASSWVKVRTFRMGELYEQVKAKADAEGRTITDVITEAFQRYLDED